MKQVFLLIIFISISSQAYALDCPPSSTCTNTFTPVEHSMVLDDNSEVGVSATMSVRYNCDGDFEMRIDNFVGYNGNKNVDFLDQFNYLHYSFSSASEMVALDFLMNGSAFGNDPTSIPFCSSGDSLRRVFVYTASCGIWIRCSYKLPSPIEYVCDTGWQGSFPHYSDGGDAWVDHWKWQSCGDVCCRKIFSICRESYVDKAGSFIKIKSITKGKYPGSDCSKQGTFWGKRPGPSTGVNQELQCEDGC